MTTGWCPLETTPVEVFTQAAITRLTEALTDLDDAASELLSLSQQAGWQCAATTGLRRGIDEVRGGVLRTHAIVDAARAEIARAPTAAIWQVPCG